MSPESSLQRLLEEGMRYSTTPAWVHVMLIVMGLGFAVAAIGLLLFVREPVGAINGGIWLVVGAGMAFFAFRALKGQRNEDRIRREGTAATATLLDAKTTGWFINRVPQWALRLRIDGAGASYETTLKMLTYNPPMTGATFSVRIDPARREHIVLADDQAAASDSVSAIRAALAGSSGNASQVQAALEAALKQAGLAGGESAVVNPDGSRTITMTATTLGSDNGTEGEAGASHDPAETIHLLADLERMRASGALGQSEFDTLKQKLLGEN